MAEDAVPLDEHEAQQDTTPLSFVAELSGEGKQQLASVAEVPLSLEIRLGEVTVPLAELLELQAGCVLTLDRGLEEPVAVLAGGKVIAHGEIVAVGDQLGVRIQEVATSEDSTTT